MRWLLAPVLLLSSVAYAAFQPTPVPVSPDGTAAVVDLPASQHMHNAGGSDGAGLCVFTSVQHAAYWQNVRALDGFRAWMQKRPGGGWPQKLDDMLAQFAKQKGVPLPAYIQHTGGDPAFLALALHTDRMPCVTYSGLDDFYRDMWGRPARIAHMVNLAHLDDTRAAIIDNNRPGKWVWMTRDEFLARWADNGGGWAVVLLEAPPPPHTPAAEKGPCICGDSCKCKTGECPAKCPVAVMTCKCCKPSCTCRPGVKNADCECYPCKCGPSSAEQQCPNCPNGRCPIPIPAPANTSPAPFGNPPSVNHEWGYFPELRQWGWRLKVKPEAIPATAPPGENFGVALNKIHSHPEYSICGQKVTRSEAHAAMGAPGGGSLADDSDRWHLTAVGDPALLAKFRADVAALPADVRGKLLVQCYAPADWPVAHYRLPAGVSLRRPSPVRTSTEVGAVSPADYTADKFAALLALPGGPTWKPAPPVPPMPQPTPPSPVAPAQPDPTPAPPAPAADRSGLWALGLLAALAAYYGIRTRAQP